MSGIGDEFEKSKATPLDAAFKAAFQKRDLAKSFFRHYFPEQIVKLIDFRSLKLNNRSYVDEKLKEKHSDIVYRTRIKGKTAFLYILFEHQSTPDRWIVFRLLCYMSNLWREFLESNPKAERLPPVLPAVLYHGRSPWNAPRTMQDIVDLEAGLESYIPNFTYELYNLGDYPDERLLLGDYMALGVVLYLMKHIHDEDYSERFVQAAEYLGGIDDQKVQLEFLEWMLRYSYHARDDDREYIDRGLDVIENENARRVAMTIAERLKQEGRMEGRAALIQKLLNKRFGRTSPILKEKLQNSNIEVLDKFGEDILDFNDLKEAENWWETHGKEGNA